MGMCEANVGYLKSVGACGCIGDIYLPFNDQMMVSMENFGRGGFVIFGSSI